MSEDEEYKWQQYDKLIDLHKFYFENLLKSSSYSFGIIGAILTYIINAKLSLEQIHLALQFPLLLSIGTFVIFCFGIWKTWEFSRWVIRFQDILFEGKPNAVKWRPHAETLFWMSIVLSFLFLLLSIGIGMAIKNPTLLQSVPIIKGNG